MKPARPQSERTQPLPIYLAMPVDRLHTAEVQQDQMRRLRNARASQRAARYDRINRALAI